MCLGSLMIACAPTYASAGIVAPAILIVARMIQGLSLGGEYGSSATYLSEMAGKERRGFWSSFQYVTLIAGQLLALALLLVLQAQLGEAGMERVGWRIAFAVGAVLAVVVFIIRRGLTETDNFQKVVAAGDRPKSSGANLFRDHPREALLVMALTAGGTLAFYAYTTYMQKYLANTVGFRPRFGIADHDRRLVRLHVAAAGRRCAWRTGSGGEPMMIFFGVAGALLTYPLFVDAGDDDKSLCRPSGW